MADTGKGGQEGGAGTHKLKTGNFLCPILKKGEYKLTPKCPHKGPNFCNLVSTK